MTAHRIWLLKLILPIRFGAVLSAIGCFGVLFLVLNLGTSEEAQIRTPLLFFSAIIAYAIWVFDFITRKSRQALQALRPYLELSESDYADAEKTLGWCLPRQWIGSLLLGLAAGIAHVSLITGSLSSLRDYLGIFGALGTLLVWVVMCTMINFLVAYARLFARLGGDAITLDLLDTRPLVPFSRVATNASLAMIGAMALFPLMYLDQSMTMVSVLPGILSMLVPLGVMFAIPIWPIHLRLVKARNQALQNIDRQIRKCRGGAPGTAPTEQQLVALSPLLQYRREILQVPQWPFDASSYTRMGLYLIIVPLTWAGAALLEMLMESYL